MDEEIKRAEAITDALGKLTFLMWESHAGTVKGEGEFEGRKFKINVEFDYDFSEGE